MLNLSASRHSCLPTPVHSVRATPGESADLVINQLFGSLSGSGPADSFQDFLSQLFSKNVLDKADTQFSGTEVGETAAISCPGSLSYDVRDTAF